MYEVFNADTEAQGYDCAGRPFVSDGRTSYMQAMGYAFGIFPSDDRDNPYSEYHSPEVPILATREDVPNRICDMLTRFYNNMGADGLAIKEDISDVERAARAMVWLAEREPNVNVAIRRDVMDYMHTK